jgi:hypothetical protein
MVLCLLSAESQAQDHDPCAPSFPELNLDSTAIGMSNEPYWDSLTRKLVYDSDKAKDVAAAEDKAAEKKGTGNSGEPPKDDLQSLEKEERQRPYALPEWLGKTIMFLLSGIIIGFLVYLIIRYGLNKRNVKNKQQSGIRLEDVAAIEENLPETDLEPWLREALNQKNYELAIRLYYLRIVQALAEKKMITWKKDKTNQSFIEELYGNPRQLTFTQLTYFHDLVFYGQRPVTEQVFQQWLPRFRSMLQEVEASGTVTDKKPGA